MIQTIVNIRLWHEMLHKRTKTILTRNSIKSNIKTNNNFINDSKALIQRFNASCRVARKLPHLAASKLLMKLNDYDLPIHYTIRNNNNMNNNKNNNNNNNQTIIILYINFIIFIIITILFHLLPDLLRDTIIESATNAYVNAALFAMIASIHKSFYIPIFLIIIILILYFIYQLNQQKYNNKLLHPDNGTAVNKNSKKTINHSLQTQLNQRIKFNTVFPINE